MVSMLCLSFIATLSSTPVFVPEHVERVVKARLQQQLKESRADIDFRFNDSTCPHQVRYHFSGESLVTLGGDETFWPARLELNLTELIDGKKFDFAFLKMAKESAALVAPVPTSTILTAGDTKKNKWLPWLIAAVGIGAGAYMLHSRGGGESRPDGALRLQHR